MYLVLIETSGNQNYIFSTNKLRENIGASQLTYLAGTEWVINAVAKVDGNSRLALWTDKGSKQLRDKLLNLELNPPIEETDFNIELVLAASGKAMLLVKDKDKAKAIIRQVTLQALKEAPGLEISGVIHEFVWDEERSLETAVKAIHSKFEANRSQIPSPAMRFLRLPVVEECASSGLPAAMVERYGENRAISVTSHQKREAKKSGFDRIAALLNSEYPLANFANSLQVLDRDLEEDGSSSDRSVEWLGVIHADGNGLGKIFINFPAHLSKIMPEYTNRDYANKLREFSLALDVCTEKAFLSALAVFQTESEQDTLRIFPLILGGDDLTVICDGKFALPFIDRFLIEFEAETQRNETISSIAEVALKGDRLSACAGVAIIKPHFPFSVAYELAESLAKSAKKVKEIVVTKVEGDRIENIPYPCSALDFHVVYDSSGVELSKIRQRITVDGDRTKLYCRPYVVTANEDLLAAAGENWVQTHHWNLLQQWVEVLKAKDDEGKPQLPNSQIYKLRENLLLGKAITDSYYRLIKKRYQERGITQLEGSNNSLFIVEPNDNEELPEVYMTGLLDAIEAADFL